ncbi:hypothetical protein PR048_019148 [Dryococelus australis]|uniref:Uncharacterized protein n=1 Tax=Dryococelus australis TaxID=614101 RepID=A0ABQ9H2R8_9NEOP|nr:hypothetical protein PR048_019148 [Dryococelus australis]
MNAGLVLPWPHNRRVRPALPEPSPGGSHRVSSRPVSAMQSRENPPTNGIVRHDSNFRKSGDPTGRGNPALQRCQLPPQTEGWRYIVQLHPWRRSSPLPPSHLRRARGRDHHLLFLSVADLSSHLYAIHPYNRPTVGEASPPSSLPSLFQRPFKNAGKPHQVIVDFCKGHTVPLGIANPWFQNSRTISPPWAPICTANRSTTIAPRIGNPPVLADLGRKSSQSGDTPGHAQYR